MNWVFVISEINKISLKIVQFIIFLVIGNLKYFSYNFAPLKLDENFSCFSVTYIMLIDCIGLECISAHNLDS